MRVCASRCGWKVFTGNEVAALLGWWMFSKWRETHSGADVHKIFMLATTVSSKILQAFARAEGFQFEVGNQPLGQRWQWHSQCGDLDLLPPAGNTAGLQVDRKQDPAADRGRK